MIPADVAAITFDSFTTLVDVHGPTRAALAEHVDDPDSVARLWRSRSVDYRMVATFLDEYEPYDRTTREALEYALAAHGESLADDAVDDVAGVFDDLDVFEDVRPGMERLHDAGYDLYVLSNGTPGMLDSVIERAGVGHLVSGAISADGIEAYKPDARIYEYGADRVGAPLDRLVHAATPWYDIYGAMGAGMGTVWINRQGRPWDRFDGEPDAVVDGFDGLCDLFDA